MFELLSGHPMTRTTLMHTIHLHTQLEVVFLCMVTGRATCSTLWIIFLDYPIMNKNVKEVVKAKQQFCDIYTVSSWA